MSMPMPMPMPITMSITREDLESGHKKALKALDGEKRAAIKKAKGTKGKKAKEAVTAAEQEFDKKLKDLEEKYRQQLAEKEGEQGPTETQPQAATGVAADTNENDDDGDDQETKGLDARERKQLKARRKKERQKEREAERQAELETEAANAGPSMRHVELEQMQAVLTPLDLKIGEVDADGHCLYRAVAAQTGRSYTEIRELYYIYIASAARADLCTKQ
jgi:OTU domain-containing protein 6